MAPFRVTSQSALPTAQRLAAELNRCVAATARLPSVPHLTDNLSLLEAYGSDGRLDIDICSVGPLSVVQSSALADWIRPGLEPSPIDHATQVRSELATNSRAVLGVLAFDLAEAPVQRAASPRSAALVCVVPGTDPIEEASLDAIQAVCEDRCLVWLVVTRDNPQVATLQTAVRRSAWHVVPEILEELPPRGLEEQLSQPPLNDLADVVRAHALVCGLSSATQVVASILGQEARSLKVSRAVTQQRASKVMSAGNAMSNEMVLEVRSQLTHQFADFERGVSERLGGLFTPQVGAVSQEVEALLAQMTMLQQNNGAKTVHLNVPEEVQANLQGSIRERVEKHATQDLIAMRDLFRMASNDVAEVLREVPLALHFQHLGMERLQRLLNIAVRFDKSYKGELPRRGPMEFFMGARRYQMLLYILMSSFGLTALRRHGFAMVAASLVLLAVGGLLVTKSTRLEREEGLAKELDRARDTLRTESRRIVAELERGWMALVTDHLKTQLSSAVTQVDAAVREAQARRSGESAEEKRRLQRQIQNLEGAERQLATADKACGAVISSLSQLRGELQQLVSAAVGPTPRSTQSVAPAKVSPLLNQV